MPLAAVQRKAWPLELLPLTPTTTEPSSETLVARLLKSPGRKPRPLNDELLGGLQLLVNNQPGTKTMERALRSDAFIMAAILGRTTADFPPRLPRSQQSRASQEMGVTSEKLSKLFTLYCRSALRAPPTYVGGYAPRFTLYVPQCFRRRNQRRDGTPAASSQTAEGSGTTMMSATGEETPVVVKAPRSVPSAAYFSMVLLSVNGA